MHSYIPAYLRSKNRGVVLHLLREHKALSRADIAKYSKISFPTVIKVVDDFLALGLVSEAESIATSQSGLGRKSQLIRLNESAFAAAGIFFEGNLLHVGLVDLSYRVIDQIIYPLQGDPASPDEYERISMKMTDAVDMLRRAHPETRVLGVGVGLPGVVDTENMTFRRWGKLHGFYDSYKTFSNLRDTPIYIENDMNAASLGEMLLRDDSAYGNLCYLSLGTGIGAGLIVNSRIWHGDAYFAGDIGVALTRLDLDTLPEDLSSLRLNSQINAAALTEKFGVDIQRGAICSANTKKEISEYIIRRLLPVLYNMNYIFDISHYVLAGTVTDFLYPVIFDTFEQYLSELRRIDMIPLQISIVPSVDKNAGIVGTANLALENCLAKLLS